MKILITAGPTRERIDAVRFITNRSTGKMGYAIAEAAVEAAVPAAALGAAHSGGRHEERGEPSTS